MRFNEVELEEAQNLLVNRIQDIEWERVSIQYGLNRVLY